MNLWYNYPKYQAEEKCRNCPHTAKFHIHVKNFGMDNQMAKFDECSTTCSCIGYAPVDNLKYLEMRADE
jgi:hypothetical protein